MYPLANLPPVPIDVVPDHNLFIECSKCCDSLGLFCSAPIKKGTVVCYMKDQERITEREAKARIEQHGGEDEDWPHDCYIKVANRKSIFWDNDFEGNCDKYDVIVPYWYMLNHAHKSIANVQLVILNPNDPARLHRLVWQAARDIAALEELRFPYGEVPPEFDHDKIEPPTEPVVIAGKRKRTTRTSTSMNGGNKNM